MGLIGSRGGGGHVVALEAKGKVGVVTVTGTAESKRQLEWSTHKDRWHWLVDNGVSRSEIDRKPTKFLLDLYKQKSLCSWNSLALLRCLNSWPDRTMERSFEDSVVVPARWQYLAGLGQGSPEGWACSGSVSNICCFFSHSQES